MAHAPVMLGEMLQALAPRPGAIYVDATFGGGGYSRALLDACACQVVGIDRDPRAVLRGGELAAAEPRFRMIEGSFSAISTLLRTQSISTIDGIVADIGVSSYQLDEAHRGFSFMQDGPLDMRMSASGLTAAEIVNGSTPAELAALFREFGEEPEARRIAQVIHQRRLERPLTSTGELASLVAEAKRRIKPNRHPATQVFQALRIAVNDELGELAALLEQAEKLLQPGGRIVIVSFHSLEDRLVKRFINDRGGRDERPSRHVPDKGQPFSGRSDGGGGFRWLRRKPMEPGENERRHNPRARSARMRVAVRQGFGASGQGAAACRSGDSDDDWSMAA